MTRASCNAREHGLPLPAKGLHRGRDDTMSEDEVVWPTGMSDQDPSARDRPLVFNPEGFLVAILEDAAQGAQVIYQTLNPPYPKWVELFPALQATGLAAAQAAGARLVSMETSTCTAAP